MNRFPFWQQWLFVVSLGIVIFGLILAVFNQTLVFDFLFNNQVNPAFNTLLLAALGLPLLATRKEFSRRG